MRFISKGYNMKKQLLVKLTEQEYQELKARAKKLNLTTSAYVRLKTIDSTK